MVTLAIPSPPTTWIPLVPRPLYFSARAFDWTPMLKTRRGLSARLIFRVFGLGLDLTYDEMVRYYAGAIGARWLVHLAGGVRLNTEADRKTMGRELSPPGAFKGHSYVEIGVLGFSCSWGKPEGEPWSLRYFFNQRRVFRKRIAR